MFKKILIANRGDVALRVLRACQDMGIATVAVHSTADTDAMHVRLADESVCIGEAASAQSYLNIPALISAATITGAEAIHPGVGFLSENADFAGVVAAHGLTFIGPRIEHITAMGDKVEAKRTAAKAGLPLVPGSEGAIADLDEARKTADKIGYPVLIKAASGGGGRGMKVANNKDGLAEAFSSARSEAKAAFGDDTVYLERYLDNPRHIEIQVIADAHGNVAHLGERECSVQRRHQKLLEEAPSPALTPKERAEIGKIAAEATRAMGYLGLGTMEFLYEDGGFFFIEMNTRLQVEHPITEAITGIDLVVEQINIASGAPLSFTQDEVQFNGHAIECRINAEHPTSFLPTPGTVKDFHAPGGPGVRVDSFLYSGYRIPSDYDSLIAKIIVHGDNRAHCLARLTRALDETIITPMPTSLDLHKLLVRDADIASGKYSIRWLEENFLPNQPND